MKVDKKSSCICVKRWSIVVLGAVLFVAGICYGYYLSPKPPVVNTVPTAQESLNNLVAFVNNAASLVGSKGEAAFTEFKRQGDPWWMGDKYIFAYDMQGNTLVLPPSPELEGINRWNTHDDYGVYFVREMAQQLQSKDSAWVKYSYAAPTTGELLSKIAYVKKVVLGNKTIFVGSGMYF